MNFLTIQDRLLEGNLHGDEIAMYRSFLSVWLSRFYEQYGLCLSSRAEWTTEHRKEYGSQAECERAWEAGPGREETTLKYKIKGYEVVGEVLTSLWFQVNKEQHAT